VVEAALAHTIKDKAEAAYARSDLLEKWLSADGRMGRAVSSAAGGGGGVSRTGTAEQGSVARRQCWVGSS
jgi:hypothetical protein